MTRSAWWLVCDALAVYRLAVLVTRDTITAPVRGWLAGRQPAAYQWITCPWCVSVWAAAAVVGVTAAAPGVWQYPAAALALSAAAGFLAEHS